MTSPGQSLILCEVKRLNIKVTGLAAACFTLKALSCL